MPSGHPCQKEIDVLIYAIDDRYNTPLDAACKTLHTLVDSLSSFIVNSTTRSPDLVEMVIASIGELACKLTR
jgi:hypothetical protein